MKIIKEGLKTETRPQVTFLREGKTIVVPGTMFRRQVVGDNLPPVRIVRINDGKNRVIII